MQHVKVFHKLTLTINPFRYIFESVVNKFILCKNKISKNYIERALFYFYGPSNRVKSLRSHAFVVVEIKIEQNTHSVCVLHGIVFSDASDVSLAENK